jgi:hypothetical protein
MKTKKKGLGSRLSRFYTLLSASRKTEERMECYFAKMLEISADQYTQPSTDLWMDQYNGIAFLLLLRTISTSCLILK